MARILIAGCGDLGTELGLILGATGHTVWGLKREPTALPAPLHTLVADLTDPATLRDLPQALNAVVYSVAAASFSEADYRAAYVAGVQNLVQALRHADQAPQRLIFVSSTSVYAQTQGEWVDENTPATAERFSARCLREGENLIWASGFPAVVVRFAGIYGPGRTRLINDVRNGTATSPEHPPLYTNRIHRDDCVAVLAHLLAHPAPDNLYLAVDDDPAPLAEILDWLADQIGVPRPARSLRTPDKPGAENRSDPALRLRASKRCCNARLRASGFQFRYPSYRDGYAALLGTMGARR